LIEAKAKAEVETLSNAPRDDAAAAPPQTQLENTVPEHLHMLREEACKVRTEFLFDPLVAGHDRLLKLGVLNRQLSLAGFYEYEVEVTKIIIGQLRQIQNYVIASENTKSAVRKQRRTEPQRRSTRLIAKGLEVRRQATARTPKAKRRK
jgi:hypothetical protein